VLVDAGQSAYDWGDGLSGATAQLFGVRVLNRPPQYAIWNVHLEVGLKKSGHLADIDGSVQRCVFENKCKTPGFKILRRTIKPGKKFLSPASRPAGRAPHIFSKFENIHKTSISPPRPLHRKTSLQTRASGTMQHSAFFHATPLLAGVPLPDGTPVSFKLEFLQPSGSFKDRGIGHMIQTLIDAGSVSRLICSSGGNAGHAVATAAQKLGLPADVFVPSTTLPLMREKIAARGANVIVSGANWNEADAEARRQLAADPGARYIPPFDDPLIWDGNSTLIDELVAASTADTLPSVIVLSVGGGGLLRGVQLGLERHGLSDRVTVVRRDTFFPARTLIVSSLTDLTVP
jgi:hypothetical protein